MKLLFLDIEFFAIPDRPGYYISRCEKVLSTRSKAPRLLTIRVNEKGYKVCKADNRTLLLHRALALVFLTTVEGKEDINHIDGNKLNNSISNLEWVSRGENVIHALRNGLHVNKETPIIGVCKTTGDGILLVSQAEAKTLGFSQPNINKCLAGLRPQHKNYEWHYA